jgi:hypothetical protein
MYIDIMAIWIANWVTNNFQQYNMGVDQTVFDHSKDEWSTKTILLFFSTPYIYMDSVILVGMRFHITISKMVHKVVVYPCWW